jgi:hypothetical protein
MSTTTAKEFGELQRLRALELRVYGIAELPQPLADAIAQTKMAPGNEHLNRLLED